MHHLTGRRIIRTSVPEITPDNVADVVNKAMGVHNENSAEIQYLWDYYRGKQPVLNRQKDVRPEIVNRIVQNIAYEIVAFDVGYSFSEPIQYVSRSGTELRPLSELNEMMYGEDKVSKDLEIREWQSVCGTAYRMVLPDPEDEDIDDAPFHIYTLDPRDTFVIYSTEVDAHPVMGVKLCRNEDNGIITFSCYTEDMCYRIQSADEAYKLVSADPHPLGMIPIIEYPARARLGSFEVVLDLLDAVNDLDSNRMDSVEQFVQAFVKFVNCDITKEDFDEMRKSGAIKIKSELGMQADVDIITSELDQTQVQTLKNNLIDSIMSITGMPNRSKGNDSGGDNGIAVVYRNGWQDAETRARSAENFFKRSERQMLKLVLRIANVMRGMELRVKDIDIKFTRRYTDNILTKVQSLQGMLEAGIDPMNAISTCGLWSDPVDVALNSAQYLQKWEYRDPLEGVEETQESSGEEE